METSREVGILQRRLHQHDFGAHLLTRRSLSKLTVFALFVGQTSSQVSTYCYYHCICNVLHIPFQLTNQKEEECEVKFSFFFGF